MYSFVISHDIEIYMYVMIMLNDQVDIRDLCCLAKKSFHGGGGQPPPTPSTSRFPRVSEASKVTQILSDFVTWQENCSVTSEKRFLSDSVIPWLCLHTSINPVSNFDLIYQLRYILLGINDIYEDLWKEYLSQKCLMKLSLLIGVMNCFSPLYSTVCHIIP